MESKKNENEDLEGRRGTKRQTIEKPQTEKKTRGPDLLDLTDK